VCHGLLCFHSLYAHTDPISLLTQCIACLLLRWLFCYFVFPLFAHYSYASTYLFICDPRVHAVLVLRCFVSTVGPHCWSPVLPSCWCCSNEYSITRWPRACGSSPTRYYAFSLHSPMIVAPSFCCIYSSCCFLLFFSPYRFYCNHLTGSSCSLFFYPLKKRSLLKFSLLHH
jgi:hypothetical protein